MQIMSTFYVICSLTENVVYLPFVCRLNERKREKSQSGETVWIPKAQPQFQHFMKLNFHRKTIFELKRTHAYK